MSNVYFISDLHFGHRKIGGLRGDHKDSEAHDNWLISSINSVVGKRDLLWVLGDVAFGKEHLHKVKLLNGVKHLILGNHDTYTLDLYKPYFNKIHGFLKYKGFWLSHAPIKDDSLRGRYNIHGHTHSYDLINDKHLCVCVEALNGLPISLKQLKSLVLPPDSNNLKRVD